MARELLETLFKLFTYIKHFILVHCLGIETSSRSNQYTSKLFNLLFWQIFTQKHTLSGQNNASNLQKTFKIKWFHELLFEDKVSLWKYRFYALSELIVYELFFVNNLTLHLFSSSLYEMYFFLYYFYMIEL